LGGSQRLTESSNSSNYTLVQEEAKSNQDIECDPMGTCIKTIMAECRRDAGAEKFGIENWAEF